MAVTKAEIVQNLCDQLGYPKSKANDLVEALLEVIKEDLSAGNDVLISGFGKFQVKEKGERRGRNPATGEDMMLVSRRVVTFKCSGKLREKVGGIF